MLQAPRQMLTRLNDTLFVVAFFLKTGQQLRNSALFAGLTTEPIDKTLQVLVAALLYRAAPRDFLDMLRAPLPSTT